MFIFSCGCRWQTQRNKYEYVYTKDDVQNLTT